MSCILNLRKWLCEEKIVCLWLNLMILSVTQTAQCQMTQGK